MPKARSIAERVEQVAAWLSYSFPCKRSAHIQWVKEIPGREPGGDFADCVAADYLIRLSRRKCRTFETATESLLHEWAHLLRGRGEAWGHDDEYWKHYGRIYRAFYDSGGDIASREY